MPDVVEVVSGTNTVEVIASAPSGVYGFLNTLLAPTSLGTGTTIVFANLPTTYSRLLVIVDRARTASDFNVGADLSDNNGTSYSVAALFSISTLPANTYMSASLWIDSANGLSARKGLSLSGAAPYLSDVAIGPINAIRINAYGPNFTSGTVAIYGMSLA